VRRGVNDVIGPLYRRCGCRSMDGRQLGFSCPRLESQPKHGRWYFAVQVDGVDGVRTRVRKGGFASRADAEGALAEFRALPSAQALARTWTVGGFLRAWLAGLEARRSVHPSTLLAYRRVVETHLVPELGSVRACARREGLPDDAAPGSTGDQAGHIRGGRPGHRSGRRLSARRG